MSTIRFEATVVELEAGADVGSRLVLRLPKSVRAKLPTQDMIMVEGVANHFPFRAVLDSERIAISDAIRKAARAEVGDTVSIELTRIGDEPETRVPADLAKALAADPQATAAWAGITPMARRDWVLSILVVRQLETREGRLVKTVDMLAHGKGRICCFPGINWLTKDHVSNNETWQPLPKATAQST